jgi:L-ascorbate metabolism protein UlaG (beta-lactamase superfamily)
MEFYSLGHSSFKIKGKNATIVTDPFDSKMVGLKFPKVETPDIVTISHGHADHNFLEALGVALPESATGRSGESFVASGPGEFDVKGVTIIGVSTFHDASSGEARGKNVAFKFVMDDINICHLGDLGHKLNDVQLDQIGDVDILLVPVGGEYTIDAKIAAEVVAQIEPYVVIPMHYRRAGLASQLAEKLEGVEKFLKEMGSEGITPVAKYSVSKDKLPENTTIVVLE